MNVALVNVFKKLVVLFPTRYVYAEDFFPDFGVTNSVRNHAWIAAPSKVFGALPERFHNWAPDYSKAMTVFKKRGQEGVDRLLSGTENSSFYTQYVMLVRTDSVANYTAITGLVPEISQYGIGNIQKWKKIKRGKDLFIAGLGGFDITATIAALATIKRYAGYAWRSDYFSPEDLQAYGYFQNSDRHLRYVLKDGPKSPLFKHLVQYRQQWTEQLLGQLDEVRRMVDNRDPLPKIDKWTPERLLAEATDWIATQAMTYKDAANNPAPFQLQGLLELSVNGFMLRQVESPEEMRAVGYALNNCIIGYNRQVHMGTNQIWCLYQGQQILGAGDLKIKGKGKNTWHQIRGINNNRLGIDHITAYETALPIIIEALED